MHEQLLLAAAKPPHRRALRTHRATREPGARRDRAPRRASRRAHRTQDRPRCGLGAGLRNIAGPASISPRTRPTTASPPPERYGAFPVILDHLAAGWVNVTTVKVLAPALTDENHGALLKEARHRRRSEVEVIVARVAPRVETPGSVRKLPARKPLPLRRPSAGCVGGRHRRDDAARAEAVPASRRRPMARASRRQARHRGRLHRRSVRRPIVRRSNPWRRRGSGSTSQWDRRRTTPCGSCRTCSPARSPAATYRRWSNAR